MKLRPIITKTLLAAVCLAAFVAVPASAAVANTPKQEIVYATLDGAGAVKNVYVVNSYELDQAGEIIDYGDYRSVTALSRQAEITSGSGGLYTIDAPAGSFYYQGELQHAELPWLVTLRYTLDGKEISASDLGGKSGQLTLTIDVDKNPVADPVFFDNFVLQISVTLSSDVADNITADGEATSIAAAGSDRVATFIVFSKEKTSLHLSARVHDFEMDGVQFAGVPISFNMDGYDTSALTGDFNELSRALRELDNGVGELLDGTVELNDGANEISDGIGELNDGATEMQDGVGELRDGVHEFDDKSGELTDGVTKLHDGATELADGAKELMRGSSQMYNAFTGYAYGLDKMKAAYEQAQANVEQAGYALYGALSGATTGGVPDPEQIATALEVYNQAYAALVRAVAAYTETATAAGFYDSYGQLNEGIKELSQGLQEYADGMGEFDEKTTELTDGIAEFRDAIDKLADGTTELTDGIGELHNHMSDFTDGVSELTDGIRELKDGTAELRSETGNMDKKVEDKLDELLADYGGGDFTLVSFVSPQNVNISSVQFVLQSEAISYEVEADAVTEQAGDESFWQRLSALTRYWDQFVDLAQRTFGRAVEWWQDWRDK